MARNRSTTLILIGAAVFIVGTGLAFLAVGGGDSSGVRAAAGAPAQSAAAAPVAGTRGQVAETIKVPEGKEAVTILVSRVAGLAGYAEVGDRVNVYGTFKDRQPAGAVKGPPLAKLVVTNAEVLAVTAPPADAEGGSNTYLLAVSTEEAEKVIYLASYESIWLTLTRDGAPPVLNTPGRNAQNAA